MILPLFTALVLALSGAAAGTAPPGPDRTHIEAARSGLDPAVAAAQPVAQPGSGSMADPGDGRSTARGHSLTDTPPARVAAQKSSARARRIACLNYARGLARAHSNTPVTFGHPPPAAPV